MKSYLYLAAFALVITCGSTSSANENQFSVSALLGATVAKDVDSSRVGFGFGGRVAYELNSNIEFGLSMTSANILSPQASNGSLRTHSFGSGTVTDFTKRNSDSLTLITADAMYRPTQLSALSFGVRVGIGLNSWSDTYSTTFSNSFFGSYSGTDSDSKTGFAIGPSAAYEFKINQNFSIEPRASYMIVTVNSIAALESMIGARYRF
jgi:hypothetical protein